MKKCPGCGAQCEDTARFCTNCGAPFEMMRSPDPQDQYGNGQQNSSQQNAYGGWQQNSGQQNAYGGWQQNRGPQDPFGGYQQQGTYGNGAMMPYNTFGIRRRSIVLAVIFTIITFGIYGIYWMIRINDDVNQLANEPEATSGGLVFLFSLITLGIYSYYWLYKMGERCDAIRGEWNGNKSILYLILGLVGLSIVSYALIQDVINKSLPMQGY